MALHYLRLCYLRNLRLPWYCLWYSSLLLLCLLLMALRWFSNLLFRCSSVSWGWRCLRWAKECSRCSAVSCCHLLRCCSRWISSRHSRSSGVSLVNLPRRWFPATSWIQGWICCCLSFARDIGGDWPTVNIVVIHRSKACQFVMNKTWKCCLHMPSMAIGCLETHNALWRLYSGWRQGGHQPNSIDL